MISCKDAYIILKDDDDLYGGKLQDVIFNVGLERYINIQGDLPFFKKIKFIKPFELTEDELLGVLEEVDHA